jgi:RNA polymerase sigma-32 factor
MSMPQKSLPSASAPVPRSPATPPREGSLDPLEEQRLALAWSHLQDTAALATLVEAHLGLVVKIATEFRHTGPSLEDLIQEGNLGLTIAARRFDPTAGTRLATYATYWIRACMMEHVVRSHGPVRIGTTRAQRKIFFGLGRARRRIERNGHEASNEALADELGVARCEIDAMTPRLSGRDLSLDAPRALDDERDVGSLLAEPGPSPETLVAGRQEETTRKSLLRDGLRILDPRERAIIRARHLAGEPATLESLGQRFRVSRERVRQIETRAVAKLRAHCVEPEPARPPSPRAGRTLH